MKIFYDHTVFAHQKYGGIARYFCELFKNIPEENWYLSVWLSNNQYLNDYNIKKTIKFFPKKTFRGQGRIQTELGLPYTMLKLNSVKWNVFHPTLFPAKYNNIIPKNKPMVITAHDVLHYLFHKKSSRRDWMVNMDIKACQRADKIIAISESTKKDYIEYYGADEKKIKVIYHGIMRKMYDNLDERLEPNPYILFVGLRQDYKNFSRFAKAFSIISGIFKDLRLVCTGFPFKKEEMDELEALGIKEKTKLVFATDQQMAQLYYNAEMFVFPSVYEGFGRPIFEAMMYNCPVLLSDKSCFPEVAQSAGIYFNPYDIDDIANKMHMVLVDTALREKYIKLGEERVTHFTWDKCAKKHMEVYMEFV